MSARRTGCWQRIPSGSAITRTAATITLINPWLNLYTIVTGRNLAGQPILGEETLTRDQALRLATADTKWFIGEEDIGSIEVGCHADLAVLDRDYFKVPDEELKRITSLMTVVGGTIIHDAGVA